MDTNADVFISYSHNDAKWVKETLLPALEDAGLKVIIDDRDFEIGTPSLTNMERAVDNSRHTLAVLTPNWIRSEWTEFESLLTGEKDPAGRRRKLIPLMLETCQPPARISMLTYADFTEPSKQDEEIKRLLRDLGATPITPSMPASTTENPFFFGGAVPPEKFVGREQTLDLIKQRLGGKTMQSLSIVGERRIGKSSLLCYVHAKAKELFPANTVVIYLDLTRGYCHTRKHWMRTLRKRIAKQKGETPWTAAEDGDIGALAIGIEELFENGTRLVLCLDEMENLTKRKAEFDDLLDELRGAGQMGQIGMLTASAQPLADLCESGGLNSPFFNIFQREYLGLLQRKAWQRLLGDRLSVTPSKLADIQALAGYHPFFTQIAAYYLWEARYNHSPTDWQSFAKMAMKSYLQDLWQHLTPEERQALKQYKADGPDVLPKEKLIHLTRRGLLHANNLFSETFSEIIS